MVAQVGKQALARCGASSPKDLVRSLVTTHRYLNHWRQHKNICLAISPESVPKTFLQGMEAAMKREIEELLEHVPMLARVYGKWPSYIYLVMFTPLSRGLLGAVATIAGLIVYHRLP